MHVPWAGRGAHCSPTAFGFLPPVQNEQPKTAKLLRSAAGTFGGHGRWSPIAVLRHLSVQAVCLRQDLGVWTDRACLQQRRLFRNREFDVLTAVRQFRCTQFLSIRTALQTTLQFAGYLRHYCITARGFVQHQATRRSQWPLACLDNGFETPRGHGSPSLVLVVCCRIQVSA
jgi:hypothetical protein